MMGTLVIQPCAYLREGIVSDSILRLRSRYGLRRETFWCWRFGALRALRTFAWLWNFRHLVVRYDRSLTIYGAFFISPAS